MPQTVVKVVRWCSSGLQHPIL